MPSSRGDAAWVTLDARPSLDVDTLGAALGVSAARPRCSTRLRCGAARAGLRPRRASSLRAPPRGATPAERAWLEQPAPPSAGVHRSRAFPPAAARSSAAVRSRFTSTATRSSCTTRSSRSSAAAIPTPQGRQTAVRIRRYPRRARPRDHQRPRRGHRHRGAPRRAAAQGFTIAVLGTGVDWSIRASNRALAGIARSGALISEFPLGTPPRAAISRSATASSPRLTWARWWSRRRAERLADHAVSPARPAARFSPFRARSQSAGRDATS